MNPVNPWETGPRAVRKTQPEVRVRVMEDPIPSSEDERTQEALALVAQLRDEEMAKLTSWEMQTINDILEGKAATTVRLREIRAAVKRLRS